jgi:hypothetical protein
MPQQKPEQPPAPVVLTTDAIIAGRFYQAGDALPFTSAAGLPAPLKPFVISEDDGAEPPGPPGIRFEPGVIYNIDDRGAILTRAGAREAARLAGEAAWQQQAEEEALRQGEPPPETIAAPQDEHDKHIGLQIKAAEVAQARIDATYAQAQEAAEREAEPVEPQAFHVKRGAVYRKAEEVRLRPGETVYQRQPSGEWWAAGQVDANGGLPEVTIL